MIYAFRLHEDRTELIQQPYLRKIRVLCILRGFPKRGFVTEKRSPLTVTPPSVKCISQFKNVHLAPFGFPSRRLATNDSVSSMAWGWLIRRCGVLDPLGLTSKFSGRRSRPLQ